MAGKKTGKRLLTWVLVLVMALSLLPLNVLAASPAVMRIVRPNTDKYITYEFYNGEAKVDEQMEMSRNVQSGNTQNLKSSFVNQAACCACAHSLYFTGGSPSGLRV